MKPFAVTSVLAPTDLSDSSVPALRYARLFADHFGAKLTVMYSDPIVYPVDFAGPIESFYIAATPEHAARLREDVEKNVAQFMTGRPYDIDVRVGQPIPAILAAAREREADMIVTGTHLRHGWRRALLGSVSEGVLHASQCPVLTVASHDRFVGAVPYAVTHVLCPINFTEVARDALSAAAKVAEAFGARITLVHVLEDDEVMNASVDEEKVRQWVAPHLQSVLSYRELVVRGGPAERVLDCADDVGADLLVVGAQHKRFRESTVIGTTSERLIRFSASPVLIVPREMVRHASRESERELVAAGGR